MSQEEGNRHLENTIDPFGLSESVLGEKMDSESLFFFMLAKVSEQNRSQERQFSNVMGIREPAAHWSL